MHPVLLSSTGYTNVSTVTQVVFKKNSWAQITREAEKLEK